MRRKGENSMAKKRNIIVGQSGGPTSVINSSLAGVYKNAIERGFDKVYGNNTSIFLPRFTLNLTLNY